MACSFMLMMVCFVAQIWKLIEHLFRPVKERIVRRLEQLNGHFFILDRVIVRTARVYSVDANPKYIRDVVAALELEDAKPSRTLSGIPGRAGRHGTSCVQN